MHTRTLCMCGAPYRDTLGLDMLDKARFNLDLCKYLVSERASVSSL
jgi:hypothetical protein